MSEDHTDPNFQMKACDTDKIAPLGYSRLTFNQLETCTFLQIRRNN